MLRYDLMLQTFQKYWNCPRRQNQSSSESVSNSPKARCGYAQRYHAKLVFSNLSVSQSFDWYTKKNKFLYNHCPQNGVEIYTDKSNDDGKYTNVAF